MYFLVNRPREITALNLPRAEEERLLREFSRRIGWGLHGPYLACFIALGILFFAINADDDAIQQPQRAVLATVWFVIIISLGRLIDTTYRRALPAFLREQGYAAPESPPR